MILTLISLEQFLIVFERSLLCWTGLHLFDKRSQ